MGFILSGCHNQVTLNNNMFSHISEGWSSKSRCRQGHAPSEGSREESFLACSGF